MPDIKNNNENATVEIPVITEEMKESITTDLVKTMGTGAVNGSVKIMSQIIENIIDIPVTYSLNKERFIKDIANMNIYTRVLLELANIDASDIENAENIIYSKLIEDLEEIKKLKKESEELNKNGNDENNEQPTSSQEDESSESETSDDISEETTNTNETRTVNMDGDEGSPL